MYIIIAMSHKIVVFPTALWLATGYLVWHLAQNQPPPERWNAIGIWLIGSMVSSSLKCLWDLLGQISWRQITMRHLLHNQSGQGIVVGGILVIVVSICMYVF